MKANCLIRLLPVVLCAACADDPSQPAAARNMTFEAVFADDPEPSEAPVDFGVYAEADAKGAVSPFLDNLRVSLTPSDAWEPASAQAWPRDQTQRLTFRAYAPYADASVGIAADGTDGATLTYAPMCRAADQRSLYAARPLRGIAASDEALAAVFEPLTVEIGFAVSGQGEAVSSIVVAGVAGAGSVRLEPDAQGAFAWRIDERSAAAGEFEAGLNFDPGRQYVTVTSEMKEITSPGGCLRMIPQLLTDAAVLRITIDGKESVVSLRDFSGEWKAGEKCVYRIAIPSNDLLDYTDNGSSRFLLAPTDGSQELITWYEARDLCPEGFRLPTQNEALLVYLYRASILNHGLRYASYWTRCESRADASQAVFVDLRGIVGTTPKEGRTVVRYITDALPGSRSYPYIDASSAEGPVIVSRDTQGGVRAEALHPAWSETPAHTDASEINAVSARLQVAREDLAADPLAWNDVACPAGWRLPTVNELMLIFCLGGGQEQFYEADSESPYYNPVVAGEGLFASEGFEPLQAEEYLSATQAQRSPTAYCIRMNDGIKTSAALTAPRRVRCVRDVE